MRISDWSSDVCSSDLRQNEIEQVRPVIQRSVQGVPAQREQRSDHAQGDQECGNAPAQAGFKRKETTRKQQRVFLKKSRTRGPMGPRLCGRKERRSEEHTSELQSIMRH